MEMRFYLRIIRKGWWLILITAIVALNLSLVYSYYVMKPTYEAVARFIVSPNLQNIESRDLVNSLEALDKRSIISTPHATQSRPRSRETPSVSVRTIQAGPPVEPPPLADRL